MAKYSETELGLIDFVMTYARGNATRITLVAGPTFEEVVRLAKLLE